jgi:hypothetical protein
MLWHASWAPARPAVRPSVSPAPVTRGPLQPEVPSPRSRSFGCPVPFAVVDVPPARAPTVRDRGSHRILERTAFQRRIDAVMPRAAVANFVR